MFSGPVQVQRGHSFDSTGYAPPTAYLTTDLVVASSTATFQDLLGFAAHDLNLRRTVYDLATDSPTDLKNLDRVLRCIKAIIQQEDPHYRTPPSQDVYNVLQRSSSMDLRASLQGPPVIEEYFDFRRSDSAVIKGFARFYLSRAGVYFVAMEVVVGRNRSFTGPASSGRIPEAPSFPQIPHRNSADNIQNQRPPHRRSFPSPNFSTNLKSIQSSPSIPALSRGMGLPASNPVNSTYPPPAPTHRRDQSLEMKQSQPPHPPPGSISSLKQYSVSSGSYTSTIDTRSSPGSIISPGVGSIYASPTELTPRTEHIQLPPLRGMPSMPSLSNREHENRGLGIQLHPDKRIKEEPAFDPVASRRGRIGVKEIVE
ncbi:hypothetical protein ABW19_dt0203536 [Dactylella cylindrospora]|nr:hypothetical protein ABW19_dt0203536 [Dactylella cylindrospora]